MAGQPKWRKIAEDLGDRIAAGEFDTETGRSPPPREPALQIHYEASRNQVRDAIRWLADQRVVETVPGKGTYVLFRPDPSLIALLSHKER
jgi:GntR family transcriptional regulator